jgi:kynurenine formamidase
MRDLSHEFGTGLPYPGDPAASVSEHATMAADGYRVTELGGSTHSGTHVDAPSHLLADGASLGAFAPEEFRFDAHIVDCTDCGEREPIPAARIPETDANLLVFHTGFAARWGDESYFDHPYLTEAAAERCATQGCAVGLDAASPDPTPTENASGDEPEGYPAHRALLGADCLLLENLADLSGLPERVTVHAHPLPVDADGAPARVVAEC